MIPISVTNVLKNTYSDDDQISCKQVEKEKNTHKTTRNTYSINPYNEVLFGDPFFLAPIRKLEKRMGFVTPILWKNAVLIIAFHVVTVLWTLYVFRLGFRTLKWQTLLFGILTGQLAGFGVTAGAHRYWCHRSYKAKLPLQLILAFCYSIAGQNKIYDWVRDHRVHHKYSETPADPHNANRGFFFSHVGWLMMKKHPDILRKGAKIDMNDIANDPVVKIYTKYFILFKISLCWVLPSLIPMYMWGEEWDIAVVSAFLRYMLSLNFTWSVNSFAHLWGNKPYDRHIMPAENKGVSIVAMGEGWHNYHHTFPWDYKAAELGMSNNSTTYILDLFAKIGWAYDMKEASPALVRAVAKKRGEPR